MRILILEDATERIVEFKRNLIGHEVIYTSKSKECIEILQSSNPFDYAFLDHDLVSVFEDSGEGTGYEVADWIANNPEKAPKKIIIHSLNGPGANNMRRRLGDAKINSLYMPFVWHKIRSDQIT